MAEPPEFNLHGVIWGHTVLLQALIVQLIGSGALTVEAAQRVFALAFQRTAKELNQLPETQAVICSTSMRACNGTIITVGQPQNEKTSS